MDHEKEKMKGALKGCVDILNKVVGMPDRILTAYGIQPTYLRRQLSRADEAIHTTKETTNDRY